MSSIPEVGEVLAGEHTTVTTIQTMLSEEAVAQVDEYVDEVFSDPESESWENHLVGQIRMGKQLRLEPTHPKMKMTMDVIGQVAMMYLKHYWSRSGTEMPGNPNIKVHDLWSVHTFEHDYNPIHHHSTPNPTGLSFTFYTKVPPQILEQDSGSAVMNRGPYVVKDGWLHFIHGEYHGNNLQDLRFPAVEFHCPHRGLLLMWPKWLPHYVPPFEGEGERRSIAGNLDIWYGSTAGDSDE